MRCFLCGVFMRMFSFFLFQENCCRNAPKICVQETCSRNFRRVCSRRMFKNTRSRHGPKSIFKNCVQEPLQEHVLETRFSHWLSCNCGCIRQQLRGQEASICKACINSSCGCTDGFRVGAWGFQLPRVTVGIRKLQEFTTCALLS